MLAPIDGIVSERLLDPGEMAAPRAPIVVLTDLDHAWAEVFVDEPQMPRLSSGSRRRSSPTRAAASAGNGQLHLVESRVHAAQRADGRRSLEARLPREDRRRQSRRRAQAGHAGRSGDSPHECMTRPDRARSASAKKLRRRSSPLRELTLVGRARRDVRSDRPGRRRQDHDDPADVRAAEGRRRDGAGARPRSGQGPPPGRRSRSAICRSDSASTAISASTRTSRSSPRFTACA